jgi:hypothetical protein
MSGRAGASYRDIHREQQTAMTDSAVTEANDAATRPAHTSGHTAPRRLGLRWRPAAIHPATLDVMTSGLVNVQVWADQAFWRPAALWAGLAGALSAGVTLERIDWRGLALALLLVDVLWSAVWRLAGGRKLLLPLPPRTVRQQAWLPYLQPASPAARVFSSSHQDLWPLAFRVGAPTMLLALLIAAVLGIEAVVLTLVVIMLTVLGWTARHTLHGVPIVLASLVSVGLPWLLLLRQHAAEPAWGATLAAAVLWTIHHWGEVRILSDGHDAIAMLLLAVGELGVCALLIVGQAPLWLAAVVLLLLPTWLAIVQGRAVGRRMQPLWLLAMLLSALALRQMS